METYQNILCVTDFSVFSKVAAQRAADLARRYNAQLTLLHVIEYFPEDRSNVDIAPEDADPKGYREKQARALLAELSQNLAFDNVVEAVLISTQSAKQEIIRFAEEQNIDLIVLATHGRHGINPILGSTTYGVAHRAPCDILAVRAKA
jgi:universal stress protein A